MNTPKSTWTLDYHTDQVPATAEYVLEFLRFWHRDGLFFEEPTETMTVGTLAMMLNDLMLFWWELVPVLNDLFAVKISKEDWKPVLAPMGKRTVREVCEFVAARMGTRPAIRPWRYIGRECLPAGVFLAMRALLVEEGANPQGITPYTFRTLAYVLAGQQPRRLEKPILRGK